MTLESHLDQTFAALAHPTRRAILARLAQGDATVNDLAAPFEMSLPAVSRHIKVLEEAGLISRGRNAQFRPCKLNPEPVRAVADWAAQYQHIWGVRFDAMDDVLKAMKDKTDE
ncbi:ArsR/SmtB family transcription factor [Yoonia sp. R2331]|uniref:ArsR/SmtB family transcription factor n=1 Tax=Yoonia sp. R2331 TaxID=3237238 RepID=UPI0034E3FB3D